MEHGTLAVNPAELAGWVGTATALGGYAYAVHKTRPIIFHWANAVGSIGIGISAAAAGAWPNLVLTVCFGRVGALGVVQYTRGRMGPETDRNRPRL